MSDKQISDLKGCGPTTLEKFETNGISTLLNLATCSPKEIASITGLSENKCRDLIKQARDMCDIGFTTGIEAEKRLNKFDRLSTGCVAFDKMLNGGFVVGGITQLYGKTASSKSQTSHHMCVLSYVENPDNKVFFIDSENTFSPNRIREMATQRGLDADKVLANIQVAKAHSMDHQMMLTEKVGEMLQKDNNYRLLVIDSITSHLRSELVGRGVLSERQGILNKHLHQIMKLADVHSLVVIGVNQIMSDPGAMFGNPEKAIGGNILSHCCKEIIYLRAGKAGSRVAKLVDSTELAETECSYMITAKGIEDI